MQKIITPLSEINLVGISARTSNANEMSSDTSQIGLTMQKFFGENIAAKISNKHISEKIFSVYTNYESDFNGEYTYFIGLEVTSFDNQPTELESITLPVQSYAKFTSNPGKIPEVVINMWQKIWQMNVNDFGGERAYLADFEIYDERSADPENAVVDIYIGIK